MGNASCKECANCDSWNDRFQGEKFLISHCESVEDFLYYLPRKGEAVETLGAPPVINVRNYECASQVEEDLLSEFDERQMQGAKADISMEDGEYAHRSVELLEGERNQYGLIEGTAKAKYKDLWK